MHFALSSANHAISNSRGGRDGRGSFTVENRTGNAHRTGIRLSLPVNATYVVIAGGVSVPLVATGNPDYPWRAEVPVSGGGIDVELRRR